MSKLIAALIFLLTAILLVAPVMAQGPEMIPLKMDGKERGCLDCHRFPNINTNEGVLSSQSQCLECHAKAICQRKDNDRAVSLQVTLESFKKNRHTFIACLDCHRDVARSPHKSLTKAQCLACHPVHGEGTAGDPHLRVSCQACHSPSNFVFLDRTADKVRLTNFDAKMAPIGLIDHALADTKDKALCLKCHVPNNQVGAAASVLPSKSLLCLVCHNAPLSVGHPMFWAAFLILILGLLVMVIFWFQGSVQGEEQSIHKKISLTSEEIWRTLFSREGWTILKTIFFDIFLQRRLLQESVQRWSIHSLIYLSILLRFGLSLFTYLAFRISPRSSLALALIDKNNPFVAFTCDLLGLLILLGLLWAVVQRFIVRPPHRLTEGQDNWALALIGLLVLLGFKLEAIRILMTRLPAETAVYSFVAYPLSRLYSFFSLDWSCWYVYLWYTHAAVGALFIACLPFGKMKHVLLTPLTLILNYKRK
jgi:hypothetical protein